MSAMSHQDLLSDPSHPPAPGLADWLALADELGARLRLDITEREQANASPAPQIAMLRDAGLLTLTIPTAWGGKGQPWHTAVQTVRRLARSDGAIAQLLGYHYAWLRIAQAIGGANTQALLTQTASQGWFWASAGAPRAGRLVLHPRPEGGFLVQGESGFATGAAVADRLFVRGVDSATQRVVVVALDTRQAGVEPGGDWNALGLRQSASDSLRLVNAAVAAQDVLGTFQTISEPPPMVSTLGVLAFQSLFTQLHLGMAEGAVLEAADYVRQRAQPWVHAQVAHAQEDPHIQNGFGQAVASLQAVAALAERADAAVSWLFGHAESATPAQRAEVAELVACAKIISVQAGLAAASDVFNLTGARATRRAQGLDRHWRDLRTLTLHDPLAYKLNEVGRYFLGGEAPEPSNYR